MGHAIYLSDESFHILEEVSQRRGQPPELLLEELIAKEQASEHTLHTDLDDFFRSLGTSEETLSASRRIYAQEWENTQREDVDTSNSIDETY